VAIELKPEERKRARTSVRRFCEEHLDLDIGDLRADLVIDYFLREFGPTVYNGAIADAQTFLRDRVADLDGVCYEPEFVYWPKSSEGPEPGGR